MTVGENDNVKKFKEDLAFAEPEFFQIFNFPILAGQSVNVLNEPYTAIISERVAKKIFW